jgi:hypothetical protein
VHGPILCRSVGTKRKARACGRAFGGVHPSNGIGEVDKPMLPRAPRRGLT